MRATLAKRIVPVDDKGFTLVELLAAIFILSLVLTGASMFLIGTVKIVTITQSTTQGASNASTMMNELSRVIRSGTDNPVVGQQTASPTFQVATATAITMYSYVNSYDGSATMQVRPTLIQFSLNSAQQLVEKKWLPLTTAGGYFTFPSTTATPSSSNIIGGPILAVGATPATTDPLFTFIDLNGAVLTPPGTGFTQTQLSSIAAVKVTIRVAGGVATAKNPNTVLQNTVRIPNLGFTDG